MEFQTVKAAIKQTLNDQSLERFDVFGYQRQSKSAEDFTKLVNVFYRSGSFPKSAAGIYGSPVKHEMEFEIEYTVSAAAEADLSKLNSDTAAADEIAIALAAMKDGSAAADELIDQLFSDVWNIIMNAENAFFGLNDYKVQDRWLEDIQKDNPIPQGEYVVLSGRSRLTCTVEEIPGGETGTAGTAYNNTVNIQGDPNNNAGASGTLGG
jgi:hypothetical protein